MRRAPRKPETNMPHFIWAFMNPDRHEVLRKKTLKDLIKTSYDNNGKGRKGLLDSLERVIRHNEMASEETSKNIRLTFNYPGTKRALIYFANIIAKIDNKIAMARDTQYFITRTMKEAHLFENFFFIDPIQGITTSQPLLSHNLDVDIDNTNTQYQTKPEAESLIVGRPI